VTGVPGLDLLADLAEVDARKLYLPAGYPSMFAYCLGELRLCEQAALKRIQAARAGRRFPAIFDAVAEGRLHLSGVVLLAPYLSEATAGELLGACAHKSKSEIERLLAERFPKSDVLAWTEPTPSPPLAPSGQQVPGSVACQLSPGIVAPVHDVDKVTPLSTQSYAVQFTMSQEAHAYLRYAQALLGRRVRPGDIGKVVEQALAVFVAHLEKGKFAATTKPRHGHRRSSNNPRHISARVKRAVWERDGGQCTFVSEDGHRCPADTNLEFDHVLEVARGGEATVEGIRLLCRAHNQYAAERTFGSEFMRHKRIAAGEARAAAKERPAAGRSPNREVPEDKDVVPWLRGLGFSAAEARRAAERCEEIPDASLEERVRFALKCFRARGTHVGRAPEGAVAGRCLHAAD